MAGCEDTCGCGDEDFGSVEDGCGGVWALCSPLCQLQVVRPGKVQCDCEGE